MERFRDAMNKCRFRDLGYVGPRYTWSKLFASGESWWIRLDRALVTPEWYSRFANAKLYHLSTTASDHCILALRWSQGGKRRTKGEKPFRFEAMWLCDPRCSKVVSEAWEHGLCMSTGHPFQNCIQRVMLDFLSGTNKSSVMWATKLRPFEIDSRFWKLLQNRTQILLGRSDKLSMLR